jgi:myo-inositol-1(or 4)-monophosphatase
VSEELLSLAVRAARAGGRVLLERFGAPASGLAAKSSRTDLVSDVDRASEAVVVGMIRGERPEDRVVAEEGSDAPGASGLRWLVDPLDGTINYLWGIPHWGVSIACLDERGALVGVVHDPARDETFTAARGAGSRMGERALALDGGGDLAEALVATGFSYRAEERERQARRLPAVLPAVRDVRRLGSAALDLAWVACGRFDAFYETGLAPWDGAAGALLVAEAGGVVEELPSRDGLPSGVLACRPGLAGRLLALIDAPPLG